MDKRFNDIIQFIKKARAKALRSVNAELINLYWNVGAYIKQKLSVAEWGDKTVKELADYIRVNNPELKGFNKRGLYRMVQFYEIYAVSQIVSPVVTQLQKIDNQCDKIVSPLVTQFEMNIRDTLLAKLSWTNHLIIFSRCKTAEERWFYMKLSAEEGYSKRELERQINSAVFERAMIQNIQLPRVQHENAKELRQIFKDSYVFDFLNLPDPHSENDLQKGLVRQMKNFILEIGRDFLFVGEEYKVQVGNSDFYMDLLFYHRGLQCLVVFELKAEKFKPEHLGQLNFYLEALDRDVKRPNENPSIGILLCKDRDIEVVDYALSRNLSPAMVAEYRTQLPDKKLLQEKLNELFENTAL
ncbi:MAG: PDDEXK nuclease domain-containing protein [Flavihumibacter sp.]